MSYTQLTDCERYQIYTMLKQEFSQIQIAEFLSRSPSTISRELRRNAGFKGYRPKQAHECAIRRRVKALKAIKVTDTVLNWIEQLIRQELSPEQIVNYLRRHKGVCPHHETVYQLIYANKANGGDWWRHLRIVSKPYRKRYGHYDRRGKIKDRVSIDARPAVVDRRHRQGDWEGDTVIGKGHRGALLTLVERKTLYTLIVRLRDKRAKPLTRAAIQQMKHLKEWVKTITLDNGQEFADHQTLAKGLDTDIYFAHPYASWERGTNENTNGLIRQYFPKDTDFTLVTQKQIDHVMNRLNNRPRKTRGNKSPNELFLGQRVDLLAV